MPDGPLTMTPSVKGSERKIIYDIATNATGDSTLSNKPSDTTYTYAGGKINITTTVPKRTGYEFKGWCRTSNSTENLLASGA
mgnify:CR=1 FL=1